MENKLALPGIFDIQLGYRLQSGRYNELEKWSEQLTPQKKLFRAPDSYGYITANFELTSAFRASAFGSYTGSMLVKHTLSDGANDIHIEKETPNFWNMYIKLAYSFKIRIASSLQLSGGITMLTRNISIMAYLKMHRMYTDQRYQECISLGSSFRCKAYSKNDYMEL